jgi:SanA protein
MAYYFKRFLVYTFLASTLLFLTDQVIAMYYDRFIYVHISNTPRVSVVMIPGAGILRSGDPSPILEERITKAIAVYKARKASKILVTGNSVDPTTYDETTAMRQALLKAGIPKEVIIVDPLGIDTYSSMYRAKNIYHINTMIIASQEFHLPRALLLARAQNIDAYGIQADESTPYFRNYLREMFAIQKALINVLVPRMRVAG